MKKIITAVAAVAMAASVFAVDFSAAIKMNGSLFDMKFVEGAKPSALKLQEPKARKPHGQTGIDLNVSGDKAGAAIFIGNGYGGSSALAYQDFQLWLKPVDMVKINLGALDYCINKESIDYAGCINGMGAWGFALDITPVDGLAINLLANSNKGLYSGSPWLNAGKVGTTGAFVKYSADFGTLGVAAVYGTTNADTTVPNYDKVLALSTGYSGNFNPISLFADFTADLDLAEGAANVLKDLKADLFVKASVDAFGFAAYVDTTIDPNVKKDGVSLGAKAKVSYNLGSATPYLYVKCPNVMDETFQMEIKPGVNFNIGAAGCEVAVDIQNIYDKDNNAKCDWSLSVPFGITLSF